MIAPLVDEIAAEYGSKLKCVKVNTDESPGVATEYGIRSIPTVMIFKSESCGAVFCVVVVWRGPAAVCARASSRRQLRAVAGPDAKPFSHMLWLLWSACWFMSKALFSAASCIDPSLLCAVPCCAVLCCAVQAGRRWK
jgi:hypothetical protein